MTKGVSKVQDGAESRLTLVLAHHGRLDLATAAHGERKGLGIAGAQRVDLTLEAEGVRVSLPFTWPTWNYTTYQRRPKAGLEVLEKAYRALAP